MNLGYSVNLGHDNDNKVDKVTDRNGNTTTYVYDDQDNITEVTDSKGNVTQYTYDQFGNETSVTDALGHKTAYEYYRYGNVTKETNTLGFSTETTYILTQDQTGQVNHLYQDAQGSTRLVTDQQGSTQSIIDYDAFGNALLSSKPDSTIKHRYVGEYLDQDSGFYHLRARDYDPKIGHFVSRDRFEGIRNNPLTLNPYLYANADPVNGVDPSGHFGLGGMMAAMDIRSTLSNIQIDFGMNLFDGIMDPNSVAKNMAVSTGILVLGGTGVKLLKMLSGKFRAMISKVKYVNIAPRKLTTVEVGLDNIKGIIFDVTYQVKDHVATIRVNMIDVQSAGGKISNPARIMNNFAELAKKDGAVMLRVEGTIANPALYEILQRRYNMVSNGAHDSFVIDLISKI